MSWLYGQTWLWYLVAFLVGLVLAWLVFVRPQRRRLEALLARSTPATSTASTAPVRTRPAAAASSAAQAPTAAPGAGAGASGAGTAATDGAGAGGAALAAAGAAAAVAAAGSARDADDTTPAVTLSKPSAPTTPITPPGSDEPTESLTDTPGSLDEPTESLAGAPLGLVTSGGAADDTTDTVPHPATVPAWTSDGAGGLEETTESFPRSDADPPTDSFPVVDPAGDEPTESIPVVSDDDPTETFPAVNPALSTLDTAARSAADAETPAEGLPVIGSTAAAEPEGLAAGADGAEVGEEPTEDLIPDEPIRNEPRPDGPNPDDAVPDEAAAEKSGTDQSGTDEPVADESGTDEPVADEAATDQSGADEPLAHEPVAPGPATDAATIPGQAAGAPAAPTAAATGGAAAAAAAAAGMAAAPAADAPPFGPGSAHPQADGTAPGPEYTVKGNADSMLYHTAESPYYVRTRAEAWFTTPEAAEAAGFAPWNHRRREAAMQGLAAVAPTFTPGPFPGSALPNEDGSAPGPEFTVKGADSMLYHTTDSPYYGQTKAEAWFRTTADAEAAGFSAYRQA